MQHVFEYIIDHHVYGEENEDNLVRAHEYYVTQSSRMNKVAKKILSDKKISMNNVESFQLRKIR